MRGTKDRRQGRGRKERWREGDRAAGTKDSWKEELVEGEKSKRKMMRTTKLQ